jgi:hypothetical protein
MISNRLYNQVFLFLILLTTFNACQTKKSISGKEFIDREVLVNMLVDIHLADGVTNDRKFNRKFEVDSIDVLSPILEKYNVSREKFDTTMYVYTMNPDLLDQVYNDVLIKLNVMLDEISREDEANRGE